MPWSLAMLSLVKASHHVRSPITLRAPSSEEGQASQMEREREERLRERERGRERERLKTVIWLIPSL